MDNINLIHFNHCKKRFEEKFIAILNIKPKRNRGNENRDYSWIDFTIDDYIKINYESLNNPILKKENRNTQIIRYRNTYIWTALSKSGKVKTIFPITNSDYNKIQKIQNEVSKFTVS
jgi:hypothetical protein